jgi:Asp-tRNA(Asn)/Glu-tRNA(Gln) amidotransferase A subunit family amidase
VCGFTLGSETGGSIMGPSGANGVAGMRPTYGRVSRRGVLALCWSLGQVRSAHALGRGHRLVLQVIAGTIRSTAASRSDVGVRVQP